jgi:hypothetical protein
MTFGRVKAVGGDYVLIEIDGESKKQMAIPDSSLSRVYLDASPIRFFSRPSRNTSSDSG